MSKDEKGISHLFLPALSFAGLLTFMSVCSTRDSRPHRHLKHNEAASSAKPQQRGAEEVQYDLASLSQMFIFTPPPARLARHWDITSVMRPACGIPLTPSVVQNPLPLPPIILWFHLFYEHTSKPSIIYTEKDGVGVALKQPGTLINQFRNTVRMGG